MPRGRRSHALAWLSALAAAGVGALALWDGRLFDAAGGDGARARAAAAPARPEAAGAPAGDAHAPETAELAAAGAAPARAAVPAAAAQVSAGGEALAGALAADLPPPAPWSGRVVAAGSDGPVEGARLVLQHAGGLEVAAETDAAGRFELLWPAGLRAELAVLHPRFVDLRMADAELAPDARFALERSARLRGAVLGWPPAGLAENAEPEALLWPHDARRRDAASQLAVALDAQGRFEFPDVEPGAWNLAVRAPGAAIEEQGGLELAPGETLDVALSARAGGVLRGRVRDRASGAPIADVEVIVSGLRTALPSGSEESFARGARSDAGGAFEVSGLATGAQRVELRLPWGAELRESATIPETLDPVDLAVEVGAPARLSGQVLDAGGHGVAGALVMALPRASRPEIQRALETRDAGRQPAATADAAGAFVLPAVAAEEALVLLAFPAGGGAEGAPPAVPGAAYLAPLAAGEGRDGVLVRLPAGAAVAGRVLGEDGLPPAAAEVEVEVGPLYAGASAPLCTARADAEGFFRCEGVPPGAAQVEVRAEGYRTQRQRLEVPAEGIADFRCALVPAFAVEGRVVDEDGAGRSGVHVLLALEGQDAEGAAQDGPGRGRASAYSDAYGRFRLERLTRGRWLPSIRSGEWELARATPVAVELPGDGELLLELQRTVQPELSSVSGEVWARDGGEALDVRVLGLGRDSVVTTDGPSFRARGVEPGMKKLYVSAQGCVPERRGPLELLPGSELDLGRIELERGTRVLVRVRDAAGKPLDGASVILRPLPQAKGGPTAGAWKWMLESRDHGVYGADAAPRGRWRLQVTRAGLKPHEEIVTVGEKTAEIAVELRS